MNPVIVGVVLLYNLTGTFDWTAVDEIGDAATSGYTISKNLTIEGQGASTTTVQAANADNIADRRIFTINNCYTVSINNCTIRYGKTTDGGGIQVDGIATIESCDISYNRATGASGGGLNCRGKVTLNNSLVSNNFAKSLTFIKFTLTNGCNVFVINKATSIDCLTSPCTSIYIVIHSMPTFASILE